MNEADPILSAIHAAMDIDEDGVGVALPESPTTGHAAFVQWVTSRSTDGAFAGLDVLEVSPPPGRDDVARQLKRLGFRPNPDLIAYGIWDAPDTEVLGVRSLDGLVSLVADILRLLGASSETQLDVFP